MSNDEKKEDNRTVSDTQPPGDGDAAIKVLSA